MELPREEERRALALAPGTRLVSRLLAGARRRRLLAALRAGRLRAIRAEDVLDPEKIAGLAVESLWLFVGAGAGFALLDAAARLGRDLPPL
ncbi:MAG TPA: hypothetical protein VFY89_09770, partial [Ktedonobacterales bacterium]